MALCIVPCGRQKIWDRYPYRGPTPAREAYIGPFSKKCIEYAERFYPHSYRILSARYGFLRPEQEIENYNITFRDPEAIPNGDLINQVIEQGLVNYDQIIILGGLLYREKVRDVFSQAAIILGLQEPQIIAPLEGLRIGQQIQRINLAIEDNIPIDA